MSIKRAKLFSYDNFGVDAEKKNPWIKAHRYCAAGLFNLAMAMRDKLSAEDQGWLNAVDAIIRGDLQAARKGFEKYFKASYFYEGVDNPFRDEWSPLYLSVLWSLNEPADKIIKAARKGFDGANSDQRHGVFWAFAAYLILLKDDTAAKDFARQVPTNNLQIFLDAFSHSKASLDEFFYTRRYDQTPLAVFYGMLTAYWISPDTARKWLPFFEPEAEVLSKLGFKFFAAELLACAAKLQGNDDGGAHPIRDLVKEFLPWERTLGELEALLPGAKRNAKRNMSERRVLWRVDFSTVETDEGTACTDLTVTALEQSRQANGKWSKGRNVAMKTIKDGMKRIPGLSEQDRSLKDAIQEYTDWYGNPYWQFDDREAIFLLAGNPNVVRADDLTPMEITREEPHIDITPTPGGNKITISPSNPDDIEILVFCDDSTHLRVTKYTKDQLRVSKILGVGGITVPESARERALDVISGLAQIVPVQSDVEGSASAVSTIEADPRLYAQISPLGDGISLEFVVKPFGDGGISCRPGSGAASIFGAKTENGAQIRVRAKRDLAAERAALDAATAECPILQNAADYDLGHWIVESPTDCLELLLQLQNCEGVTVEWPRGGMKTVRRELGESSLSGAARSSGADWFELTGTAKVDESLTLSLRQLLDLTKQSDSRFVQIAPGEFIALTKEFRRRLELLNDLSSGRGQEVKLSSLAASTVDGLFGDSALVGDAAWRDVCKKFKEAQAFTPELPRTLRAELRPYQLEGFRWLARLAHWGAGACLADDMGLGKTVQALALLLYRAPNGSALVVAPTSVCGNWVDEAARFAPSLRFIDFRFSNREKILNELEAFDVIIVSYGLLLTHAEEFAAREWNTIILDEAQAVKNMGTKRSNAVMNLRGNFRMIMTGTPVENHLGELWNLFRFLNPGLLGSLASFNHRFASPIAEGQSAPKNRLKKIISPFLLRRVKEDVLDDLPTRTEVTLRVDLSDAERAFYEALRRTAVDDIAAAGEQPQQDARFAIFAHLMKLRRCCCSPALVNAELGSKIASSKLEALLSLAQEMRENGHRALIFSQFVDHLALIREALEKDGFDCLYLDGSTPAERRRELVKEFQGGKGDCFLISLRAGGTGLNLTGADYVIHMDPWWNPAVEDQASDRAHRIGQTRPVTVYRLVARDTVEEKIVDLHRSKRDLAQGLLDGADAPTKVDLNALIALIRDDSEPAD